MRTLYFSLGNETAGLYFKYRQNIGGSSVSCGKWKVTSICKSALFQDMAIIHKWQMFVKYTSYSNAALGIISLLCFFTERYLGSIHQDQQNSYNDTSYSEHSDMSVKLLSVYKHFEVSKLFCSLLLSHVN